MIRQPFLISICAVVALSCASDQHSTTRPTERTPPNLFQDLHRGVDLVVDFETRGCFHHERWELRFSGGDPVVADVSLLQSRGMSGGPWRLELPNDDLRRLDALLACYRAPAEVISTNVEVIAIRQLVNGVERHSELIIDRSSRPLMAANRDQLLTFRELVDRAAGEARPAPARVAAPAEVRATWLTTTANDAIATPEKTAATIKRLREIGLNTVYVECWKNGYTEFPSEAMRRAIGVPLKVNAVPAELQRDLLQECLTEARRNDMLCIAWFEYGFMAAHKDTHNELRARKDWLSFDQHGNDVARNGFVWLNPLHPDAQQLLIDIVVEAVTRYDLDGIQLDDRIVWPGREMGYDEYTKRLYAQEHGGRAPPEDVNDPAWCRWRQAKVEAFAKRFVKEVRAAADAAGRDDLIISLSPGPHPWALQNYLIDWPAWSEWEGTPTFDEYVPQIYRMNYERFANDLNGQVEFIDNRKRDLVAGIRLVGDGPDLPPGGAAKAAQACRDAGIAGHSWWFSRGVLEGFADEISRFYDVKANGHAPHPRRAKPARGPGARDSRTGDSPSSHLAPLAP